MIKIKSPVGRYLFAGFIFICILFFIIFIIYPLLIKIGILIYYLIRAASPSFVGEVPGKPLSAFVGFLGLIVIFLVVIVSNEIISGIADLFKEKE